MGLVRFRVVGSLSRISTPHPLYPLWFFPSALFLPLFLSPLPPFHGNWIVASNSAREPRGGSGPANSFVSSTLSSSNPVETFRALPNNTPPSDPSGWNRNVDRILLLLLFPFFLSSFFFYRFDGWTNGHGSPVTRRGESIRL